MRKEHFSNFVRLTPRKRENAATKIILKVSSGLYLNALDAIDYDLVNSLYLTLGLIILWSPGISYVYYLLFGLTGVEWILRSVLQLLPPSLYLIS